MAATCCGQHENCRVKDSTDFSCISFLSREYLSKQPLCPSANFPQVFFGQNCVLCSCRSLRGTKADVTESNKLSLVTYVYSQTHGQVVERQVENRGEKKKLRWSKWLKYSSGYRQRLEKAMAPHSSTFAWKIPWMEEPGRLQSMESWRVGYDWETSLSLFTFMHWRRKWQPTPVFLPGESQGWGRLVGCLSMGLHRVGHDWSDLAAAAAYLLNCFHIH